MKCCPSNISTLNTSGPTPASPPPSSWAAARNAGFILHAYVVWYVAHRHKLLHKNYKWLLYSQWQLPSSPGAVCRPLTQLCLVFSFQIFPSSFLILPTRTTFPDALKHLFCCCFGFKHHLHIKLIRTYQYQHIHCLVVVLWAVQDAEAAGQSICNHLCTHQHNNKRSSSSNNNKQCA